MNIELDIEKTVADAIKEAMDPAKLSEVIKTQVGDTIKSVLAKQFSTYSPFSKVVEKAVLEIVPHELTLDGASSLKHLVTLVLNEYVGKFNQETVEQVIKPTLEKMLTPAPAEIKVSAFIEQAAEAWKDHYRRDHGSDYFTAHIEESDTSDGYWTLYLDQGPNISQNACRVRLAVSKSGSIYSFSLDQVDVTKRVFAGSFYEFDATLFAMYTGKTRIIRDIEDHAAGDYAVYPESNDD